METAIYFLFLALSNHFQNNLEPFPTYPEKPHSVSDKPCYVFLVCVLSSVSPFKPNFEQAFILSSKDIRKRDTGRACPEQGLQLLHGEKIHKNTLDRINIATFSFVWKQTPKKYLNTSFLAKITQKTNQKKICNIIVHLRIIQSIHLVQQSLLAVKVAETSIMRTFPSLLCRIFLGQLKRKEKRDVFSHTLSLTIAL